MPGATAAAAKPPKPACRRLRGKQPLQVAACAAVAVAVGTGEFAGAASDAGKALVAVGASQLAEAASDAGNASVGAKKREAERSSVAACAVVGVEAKDAGELQQHQECMIGYVVEQCIGRGVFGKVFKAAHTSGKHVAIKHMVCKPGGKLTTMQKREVDALKKLRGHPNIAMLLQVNTTCFGLDLVFELLDFTLKECIRKPEPLSPDAVCRFTSDLFSGLSFAHSMNIIHRDIKPDNLLVDVARNALLVADFGWARESAIGDERLTQNAYTLWYRPPEILLGSPRYDFASDVWAAGCVCIEMCEQKPAFAGKSELGVLQLQFESLGTPTSAEWPVFAKLPHARVARPCTGPTQPPRWGARAGGAYTRLISSIVTIVPMRRCTAREAFAASQRLVQRS